MTDVKHKATFKTLGVTIEVYFDADSAMERLETLIPLLNKVNAFEPENLVSVEEYAKEY